MKTANKLDAVFAAGVLYVIASGAAGFSLADGFAANGYGAHSPGGYSLTAGLTSEVVMTFVFLVVILAGSAATAKRHKGCPSFPIVNRCAEDPAPSTTEFRRCRASRPHVSSARS